MGDVRAPRIIFFAICSVPGMDLHEARDIYTPHNRKLTCSYKIGIMLCLLLYNSRMLSLRATYVSAHHRREGAPLRPPQLWCDRRGLQSASNVRVSLASSCRRYSANSTQFCTRDGGCSSSKDDSVAKLSLRESSWQVECKDLWTANAADTATKYVKIDVDQCTPL